LQQFFRERAIKRQSPIDVPSSALAIKGKAEVADIAFL
jgi:hypothetical protein